MAEDHYSLSAKVFHSIREDILNGKYQANEELKEKNIGDDLGVSRTPVREALRQLELEGLVHIIPNKGAFVEGVTLQDIKDIYEIRTLLEGLCARWAAERITQEQLEELEEIVFLSDFHYSKENWDQILELDNRFHLLLYKACGSTVLEHILSDYHHYLDSVHKNTLTYQERAGKAAEQNKAIIKAVREKNEELAEKLANEHIYRSLENIKKQGMENLMK